MKHISTRLNKFTSSVPHKKEDLVSFRVIEIFLMWVFKHRVNIVDKDVVTKP